MYDATDMKEFDAAQKQLEPSSSNKFVDLNGDEAGKIGPVHRRVSMSVRKLM